MKPLRKLAVIRDNDETKCPFGLSVSHACRTLGDSADKMQPVDEDASDKENQAIADMMRYDQSNDMTGSAAAQEAPQEEAITDAQTTA